MKTKQRILSILSCLCVGLTATAIGAIHTIDASAEEMEIFAMNAGASVRIDDDSAKSGIRWGAIMNETYWSTFTQNNGVTEDTKVAFGALVAPAGNVVDELTVETSEVKHVECKDANGNVISKPAFDENGLFTFYSSILYNDTALVGYERAAYATELVARSYIRVGEGDSAQYTYVEDMYREVKKGESVVKEYSDGYNVVNVTRSMQAIALAAMQAGERAEAEVGKYYKADEADVETSEESTGYYSEMDKIGVLVNAHADVTSEFKAYVGAAPVDMTVNSDGLTIENLPALTAGETYNLNMFSPEGKAYTQPFTYATKVIDEASDLAVFYLGDEATIYSNTWVDAKSFDGYYVLTKNIDCTGYVHSVATKDATVSNSSFSMTGHIKAGVGLTGVFEGNGYTISNLTLVRRGLFGAIAGGTVQNVAFKNVQFTRGELVYGGQNFYTLACVIEGATLKNVYVHIPTMQSSYVSNGASSMTGAGSAVRGAGLADSIDGSTEMKNCVIKIDEYSYMGDSRYDGGSLMRVADSAEGAYANFKDVYVISNVMLAGSKENEATRADAGNQTGASITIAGVKRYASVGDMQEAGNDYSSFDNGFWTVEEGKIPYFNVRTNTINVQGTYYLDMSEGKFDTEDTTTIFGSATAVIESVKIGETEYTVTNGKVAGVPVNKDGTPVQMTITLQGSEQVYNVSVIPATKLIDEASDLSVFYLGDGAKAENMQPAGQTLKEAKAFDGYYVLTKDIDCAGYVHSVTTCQAATHSWGGLSISGHGNIGLTGVFEGNGHTISNLSMNRRGLFGMIIGGTVQNVGFTNLAFTRDTATANAVYNAQDTYALACVIENAILKNVYVHIPTMDIPVTVATGTIITAPASVVRGAGLAGSIDGSTEMKNCVIKIDKYDYMGKAGYNGGSLMCVADNTEGAYADEDIKNVYVISGAVLSSSTDEIAGVKRYASVGDMALEATDNAESLGTFNSKYWTVVNGVPTWN